jgi:hypothetical protein
MSAADRMGPLERRYRVLVRLLPAEHRAARGEELIGLLLDLDEGRTRPSLRQAVGVFGLALRLRLAGPASLLLAAFLVAYSTSILATVYDMGAGALTVSVDSGYPIQNVTVALLIPNLLRLAIAVAWILGTRRAALAVFATLLAYSLFTGGLGGLIRLDLVVLVALVAAVRWGWPTPHPRVVLLATIPLAMLLWTLIAAWAVVDLGWLLSVTAAVAVLGATGGLLAHRPFPGSNHPGGPHDEPTPSKG